MLLLLPSTVSAGEIRLAVAASLADAVKEMAIAFTRERPESAIVPAFGGSGMLARQIDQGAPADIFISAHRQWIDFLLKEDRLAAASVRDLAGNALVFVGREELKISSLAGLPALRRIAIGSPKSVPAGQYAEEALRKTGIYARLAAAGQLVMAQDVRQALVYAERGEVDGAFVYRTDARLAKKVKVLFTVAADLHEPIAYPMALTTAGAGNAEAAAFFAFLQREEAKRILEKYGFAVQQGRDSRDAGRARPLSDSSRPAHRVPHPGT